MKILFPLLPLNFNKAQEQKAEPRGTLSRAGEEIIIPPENENFFIDSGYDKLMQQRYTYSSSFSLRVILQINKKASQENF